MFSFGGVGSSTGASAAYGANVGVESAVGKKSPKEAFLEYARMSPAEKMRAAMLNSLGLTEDDLKAMDPKKRALVEEKIKEMIKEKVEGDQKDQKGAIVDVAA